MNNFFFSIIFFSILFNSCRVVKDKNDYALQSHMNEWSHDYAFGSPTWDAFERFAGNPVYRGRKGMEWPVNGFLYSDPVSHNWYLYIGEYKEFYKSDKDTTTADFNCVIYKAQFGVLDVLVMWRKDAIFRSKMINILIMVNRSLCLFPWWILSGLLLRGQVELGEAPTCMRHHGMGSQSFLRVKVQENLHTSFPKYTLTAQRHHFSKIGPLRVFEKLDANAYHKFLVRPEFLCSGVFEILCHVLLVANGVLCDSRTKSFQPRVT